MVTMPFNGSLGDQAMQWPGLPQAVPLKNHQRVDPVTGEVRRPFNQVAGRVSQVIYQIRRYSVAKMPSRWRIKGNR